MQQVRTYSLDTSTERPQRLILQITSPASILSVTKSGHWIALHCMVDTTMPEQTRTFTVHTSNTNIPEKAVFIGTVLFGLESDCIYELHVFDETEVA